MSQRPTPFKNQTKYVLQRKLGGEPTTVDTREGVSLEPPADIPDRFFEQVCGSSYTIEGTVLEGVFYASDLLWFDVDDFSDKSWSRRFLTLKNEFDWSDSVRLSYPVVVTDKEEFKEGVELMDMLPNSEGVIVKGYDDSREGKQYYIPSDNI